MNDVDEVKPGSLPETLELEDKWILSQFNSLVAEVSDNFEKFELGVAAQKIYDFTWDVFCDWYIELSKLRLNSGDEAQAYSAKQVLVYVLTGILKLLHPYMPFITEEIYSALPTDCESIMISRYPEYTDALSFVQEEKDFSEIMELIKSVRALRAGMNVAPSKKTAIYIETKIPEVFEKGGEFIKRLASASSVEIGASFDVKDAAQAVTPVAKALIPMDQLVDKEKETARLLAELKGVEKEIAAVSGRLANSNFTEKAPAKVVQSERDKLNRATEKKKLIESSIEALK